MTTNRIVLPKGQLGWLYGITLSHNRKEGFGKTRQKMPKPRLVKGYILPSAELQSFHSLWFGLYQRLESVESYIKTEYGSKLEVIVSKKTEWFNPQYNITAVDIIQIIENRIKDTDLTDEVFRIKSVHLPYKSRSIYKNLLDNPDYYLERV
jgi:hypothetical protein